MTQRVQLSIFFWTSSFLKRNNNIALRFSSNLSVRKAYISLETINEFFNHISKERHSISFRPTKITPSLIDLIFSTFKHL